jgi:hypothetical protein
VPFTITDPSGEKLPFLTDSCNTTCEYAACSCVSTYTCNINPPLVRVVPHGVFVYPWNGGVLEDRTVPVACQGRNDCYVSGLQTAPCQAYIEPKAYPLGFSARAWLGVDCGCTCTPDNSGSCPLDTYALPTGTPLLGTGSLSKDATSVDIVFQ